MSDQKLIELGAEVVAGNVYLNRKLVGVYGPTGFLLYPEGELALTRQEQPAPVQLVQVEDVSIPDPEPKPVKQKAPKAKPVTPSTVNDDLLSDLDGIDV